MKVYTKTGVLEITPCLRTAPDLEVKTALLPTTNPDIMLSLHFVPNNGKKFWMKFSHEPGVYPKGNPDIEFNPPGSPNEATAIYFTTDREVGEAWDAAYMAWWEEMND